MIAGLRLQTWHFVFRFKLHLPSSHFLCLEGTSIYCALRFAVLFSEFCLSLTLVNVPAPVELKWIYKNIDELMHATCFADELERFDQAAFECIEFLFGSDSDPELMDELVSFWETTHPPSKRHRTAESTSVYLNRTPLNAEVCALINQPVLIIQGEKNELCPMKFAERLLSQLTGVPDGAILYDIKGGASMVSVVPGHASILNNVFLKFLTRLPHHRSDLVPPDISIRDRMHSALERLSQITDNPEVASLDPLCSLSFCSLAPEVIKGQSELLNHYLKNVNLAFTPIPPEGWSLRKYSQREREEWSCHDNDRISMNSSHSTTPQERVKESERVGKTSSRSESQQFHTTDTLFFRSGLSGPRFTELQQKSTMASPRAPRARYR